MIMPIALKLQFTCLYLLKHALKCVLWITYCNLSLTHCFCLKFESQIVKSLPCKCHFSKKAALCTELYRKQPAGALYCFLEKTEMGKIKCLTNSAFCGKLNSCLDCSAVYGNCNPYLLQVV